MSLITKRDLTTGEVAGSGLFDELMRTTLAHLKVEKDNGRITDANYATVYLGAMQSNLQAASQFVLQKEISGQQALLLQEQLKQAAIQTEITAKQLLRIVIDNDIATYTRDTVMPEQLLTQKEQTKAITAQIAQTTAQTTLVNTQNANAISEQFLKENLLVKQEDMLDEQILAEKAKLTNPTGGLLGAQYDKLVQEEAILSEKVETEHAQTSDTKVDGTTPVEGLMGKERALKDVQAGSFLRDAEQKAAKVFADTFAIIYSTDKAAITDKNLWGLSEHNARGVLDSLITPVTPNDFVPRVLTAEEIAAGEA